MIAHVRAALQATVGNPTRKLLLLALADHANQEGLCWPTIERLRLLAELKDASNVHRQLRALEVAGLVKTESRPGRSSVYRVLLTTDSTVTPDCGVTPDAPVTLPLTVQSPTPDSTVTQKKYLEHVAKLADNPLVL